MAQHRRSRAWNGRFTIHYRGQPRVAKPEIQANFRLHLNKSFLGALPATILMVKTTTRPFDLSRAALPPTLLGPVWLLSFLSRKVSKNLVGDPVVRQHNRQQRTRNPQSPAPLAQRVGQLRFLNWNIHEIRRAVADIGKQG
jgi:hypothetical protein